MQIFIGILLAAIALILFCFDYAAIGFIAFLLGIGVLRGYRRGKLFYLTGGRSSNGSCCD